MFVDSHCHLNFPEFKGALSDVRAAMRQASVDAALVISTTLEEFGEVHALAIAHDNFWASVGVHPDSEGVAEPSVAELVERAAWPKVIAIGETGLDYYRLGDRSVADMAWQRDRFARHIQAAQQTGKPLVIHTRAASVDTLAILREQAAHKPVSGVFHCFTETMDVARAALDLGFYISLSGIVTFKSARDLQEVARMVPMDRLLIETDSPYLAPVPFRGKTNQPAYVAQVAAFVAQLKGIPLPDLGWQTTQNFESLFSVSVVQQ